MTGSFLDNNPKKQEDEWKEWEIIQSPLKHITGYNNENSPEIVNFDITNNYVIQVFIDLKWLDEEDDRSGYENQPDSFNFTVHTPWGQTFSSIEAANSIDTAGVIEETIAIPEEDIKDGAMGQWTVIIHCGNCGDQESIVPDPFGIRNIQDEGNSWTLTYYYEFHSRNRT